jgi:hypothetical protein
MVRKGSAEDSTPETTEPIPLPLRWLRAHGLRSLTPWHLLDPTQEGRSFRAEFRKEVSGGSQPERDFLPFARRQDNDDVAGFVVGDGAVTGQVIVVHLTWTGGAERPGYPAVTRHADIWDWMKSVIDETAAWCSEEDLPDADGGAPPAR